MSTVSCGVAASDTKVYLIGKTYKRKTLVLRDDTVITTISGTPRELREFLHRVALAVYETEVGE